jgi:hypothetical protein
MMPPNAMVNNRNGGSNQYICDCQPTNSQCERLYAPTEGRFHQGRPRKSASPAHPSSPLLSLEEPRSGASSLSLSSRGDLAPDLVDFLKPFVRTLSSCSTSTSSTNAASVLDAIPIALCYPIPVEPGVPVVDRGVPGIRRFVGCGLDYERARIAITALFPQLAFPSLSERMMRIEETSRLANSKLRGAIVIFGVRYKGESQLTKNRMSERSQQSQRSAVGGGQQGRKRQCFKALSATLRPLALLQNALTGRDLCGVVVDAGS